VNLGYASVFERIADGALERGNSSTDINSIFLFEDFAVHKSIWIGRRQGGLAELSNSLCRRKERSSVSVV
jgi:hypothetical protein